MKAVVSLNVFFYNPSTTNFRLLVNGYGYIRTRSKMSALELTMKHSTVAYKQTNKQKVFWMTNVSKSS